MVTVSGAVTHHILQGLAGYVRCYAMLQLAPILLVLLIVFVYLQIPANTCSLLIVFVQQTCSKSPDANHHENKANQGICLARVLIPIHFVLVYLPDILQLSKN